MERSHLEDLGNTSVVSECSLGVNLVIDNFLCSFKYLTSVYNFKAIGPLLMEILHFKDLGDMSVVWLRTQLFWSSEGIKFQQQIAQGGYLPTYTI